MKIAYLLVSFFIFLTSRITTCFKHFTSRNIKYPRKNLAFENIIDAEIVNDISKIKADIIRLSALCLRGEIATEGEKSSLANLITKMEAINISPTKVESMSLGTWELIYSSTYLFRSSPFFMAARAICSEGPEADKFNYFCRLHREALAFTSIGHVRQVITENELKSEFETTAPYVAGLPFLIKGTIVSSANIVKFEENSLFFSMNTVKINESNVPILKDFLGSFSGLNIKQLGDTFQNTFSSYKNPEPEFRCYFIDEEMRICRDQDDNIFVYSRIEPS